ncbi:MAG: EamA family transporter [Pseudomonadota bacterium]
MQIPWYLAALGAAVVWGLHYPLVGFALKRISMVSVLVLLTLPVLLILPFVYRTVLHDVGVWRALEWGERLLILSLALTSLLGAVLLFYSIAGKNATLAALLEITYPLFVALFAWLLFREVHINASVVLGALLVFAGTALIIWQNP